MEKVPSRKITVQTDSVTIGTDCEVFAYDPVQRKYISCVDRIGGMKGNPIPIGEGCGVEEDNVSAEFTVPPVPLSIGGKGMYRSIQHSLKVIQEYIGDMYEVKVVASAIFEDDQLDSDKAKVFGCEPDYNAWLEGRENDKPEASNKNLRSAGGHVHVGYENSDAETSMELIKTLDLFLAVPSILVDNDNLRRELYGKAGAFRLKPYGFEYRTPSNFWIKNQELVDWVFRSVKNAIDFYNSGKTFTEDVQLVIDTINTSNKEQALQLCQKYGLAVPVFEEAVA